MYKVVILLFIGIFIANQGIGQNKIVIKKGKYKIDSTESNYRNIGFLGRNIKDLIEVDPIAYSEFKKYRKNDIGVYTGGIVSLIGLSSFSIGIQSNKPKSKKQIAIGSVLIVGGMITAISCSIVSKRTFKKSIHLYNIKSESLGVIHKVESTLVIDVQYSKDGLGVVIDF